MKKEPEIPLWFSLLIISGLIGMIVSIIAIEGTRKTLERNQYLRDNFSRLSDNPEIQEAYEELENN